MKFSLGYIGVVLCFSYGFFILLPKGSCASSCEEERMDDAAINRVSGEGDRVMRFAYWFTVDRHGLSALAMTI